MRPTRPARKPRAGWVLPAAPVNWGFSGETPLGCGEPDGAAGGWAGCSGETPLGFAEPDGAAGGWAGCSGETPLGFAEPDGAAGWAGCSGETPLGFAEADGAADGWAGLGMTLEGLALADGCWMAGLLPEGCWG